MFAYLPSPLASKCICLVVVAAANANANATVAADVRN